MITQELLNQKTEMESEIPSFEAFREEIRKIHPEGNLLATYERIVYFINHVKSCGDGTPVTYKLIMNKYAAHIRSWNMVYGSRDPKYWGKDAEEKRKTLWDFLGLRWYEREFVTSVGNGERNRYLFGGFSIDYLRKKLEEFKNRIHDQVSKEQE